MTDKEIDIEIERCLKLIIVEYNGSTYVSCLCNLEFAILDQIPNSNLIVGHMQESSLITLSDVNNRICTVTKLGSEIYYKFGGWLKHKKKLRNRRRWDKFLQLFTISIALTSFLWNILIFEKNGKNDKEIIILKRRIDTLFQRPPIKSSLTNK